MQLDDDQVKKNCDILLLRRSKDRRYKLHALWKIFKSDEEAHANCPNNMTPEEWGKLIEMWKDRKYQDRCEINKRNRSNLTIPHVSGSRAFVAVRHTMRDSTTGDEPDRITFYKQTHFKDGKGWSCPEAEAKWNQMNEMQYRLVADGEIPLTSDMIADNVLGRKSGQINGLGFGPKPTTSQFSSSSKTIQLEEALKATRKDASKLRDRLRAAKTVVETQQSRMESQQAQIQMQQSQIESILAGLGMIGSGLTLS